MKVATGLIVMATALVVFLAIDCVSSVRGQAAPGTVPPPVGVAAPPSDAPSATVRRVGPGDSSDRESSGLRGQDYELGRQAESLAAQYGAAKDDGAKEKVRGQLRDVLDKQFTVHHKRREVELAKLEARVGSLRELLNKRSEQRQTIVDRRLEQLVRDAEGLGWSAPSTGSATGGTSAASVFPSQNGYRTPLDFVPTPSSSPYGAPSKELPARK